MTAWLCRAGGAPRKGTGVASRVLQALRAPPAWADRTALAAGALLFVAGASWDTLGIAHGHPPHPDTILAFYGCASALTIYGAVKGEDRRAVFGRHRAWQLLGGASYALYLIHYPIVSLVTKSMLHLGLHGTAGAVITLIACVAVSIALAVVFHVRIEQPMLRALGSWRLSTLRAVSNPKA